MSSPTAPACRVCEFVNAPLTPEILWHDDRWLVRHAPRPAGVLGWMTIYSRRHLPGIGWFDDAEAAAIGPRLQVLARTLEEVTGARRIYLASLNEASPHFHLHLVPRYASTPDDVSGFTLFDLARRAAAGEIVLDAADVSRLSEAYRERLATTLG